MLWRAAFAFFALPGMVAFVVPLTLALSQHGLFRARPLGLAMLSLGLVILVWCVVEFYVSGRGTLAPWAPPQRLVTTGPYRFSRNPMYIGVALILLGWAWCFWSLLLAIYAMVVSVAFHIRVLIGEEPRLTLAFGEAWDAYRTKVPRWLY
jgi:protein-S-isoprenylcysteine O-methyltransferase Ste14